MLMLKRLFQHTIISPLQTHHQDDDGWLKPLSGNELLDQPYRKQVIKALWDLTSLTKPVFREFIQRPLENYAELVQLLPASESHHHAYAGGMLDHGLEAVNYALRIRQQHLLPPGATPEEQSSSSERWTVAVAYGALLHDAAKLLDVDIFTKDGGVWRIWHGPIPGPYRVRYRKSRDYMLHQATNGLLCHRVLDGRILDWLYGDSEVFKQLMFTMSGYSSEAGIIGEIVSQADRASVASNLGGDPTKALQAPVESLQRKLTDALRYLVKEQLALNTPRAPAYLTEEALWIVAPSVPNQLKAYLLEHGVGGVPSNTARMYDEMQAHGLIEEAGEGKSVWKADIQIDEWQATLSFLKVPAGLIWGPGEERPPALNGTLAVVSGKAVKGKDGSKPQRAEASGVASTEVLVTDQETKAEVPASPELQPQAESKPASTSDVLDFDEMVSLITGEEKQEPPPEKSTEVKNNVSESAESSREVDDPGFPSDPGEHFVQWLRNGLATHKLIVNDSKALVHVVDGTYFLVSPGIFKRFCNVTFGSDKPWNKVQQRFQKQGLHLKTEQQMNIWEVNVRGPNRRGNILKGYRLKLDSGITPSNNDNVFLSLIKDGAEAEYEQGA
ncbi:MAG: MobH family relaxase [Halomonas sp.]|uniref:MobH family relaxase n=1 Tax=Halomonas sp. TaxID=1486246 RepID=UPI003F8F26EC